MTLPLGAAYAWVVAGLAPFTALTLVAVVGGGFVAMVLGARFRRHLLRVTFDGRGVLVWAALLAILGAWELAGYVQHPRAEHPTLSSLLDPVLDSQPVRAGALLLWLAAAVDLARR